MIGTFVDPVMKILDLHPQDLERFEEHGHLEMECPLMQDLYLHYLTNGEMPIGIAKARTGDPDLWIMNRLEEIL